MASQSYGKFRILWIPLDKELMKSFVWTSPFNHRDVFKAAGRGFKNVFGTSE